MAGPSTIRPPTTARSRACAPSRTSDSRWRRRTISRADFQGRRSRRGQRPQVVLADRLHRLDAVAFYAGPIRDLDDVARPGGAQPAERAVPVPGDDAVVRLAGQGASFHVTRAQQEGPGVGTFRDHGLDPKTRNAQEGERLAAKRLVTLPRRGRDVERRRRGGVRGGKRFGVAFLPEPGPERDRGAAEEEQRP